VTHFLIEEEEFDFNAISFLSLHEKHKEANGLIEAQSNRFKIAL
jgi:hypothetical protein